VPEIFSHRFMELIPCPNCGIEVIERSQSFKLDRPVLYLIECPDGCRKICAYDPKTARELWNG
jgi:predicted RNA-binding Zn-ribbon protein involved in translation (DUF1610 family)